MAESFDPVSEPRDYTRLVWAGIGLAFVLMVAALWFAGRPDPKQSQVRARHILVKFDGADAADRTRALDLIAELRKRIVDEGEEFAVLARDYSDDPISASRGGDLGYAPRGIYDPAFEKYCWSAPVGQLSDVVQSAHGFHLIEVTDRFISDADRFEDELEQKAREALDKRAAPAAPAP